MITESSIAERRGNNYEDVVIQRAKEIAHRKRVAEEYGHDLSELSILTKPGDIASGSESDDDAEHKKSIAEFETLKAKFDSYGVGVRAGSITPQTADESAFRDEAGLPPVGDAVEQAWIKDGGYRRPITLQSGAESQAEISEQTNNQDTTQDD